MTEDKVPDEIYEWLVDTLGFPFDLCFPKPDWLNVRRLAQAWKRHDDRRGLGSEPLVSYVASIYLETGWRER